MLGREEELGLFLNETMLAEDGSSAVLLPEGLQLDLSVINYAKWIKEVCNE